MMARGPETNYGKASEAQWGRARRGGPLADGMPSPVGTAKASRLFWDHAREREGGWAGGGGTGTFSALDSPVPPVAHGCDLEALVALSDCSLGVPRAYGLVPSWHADAALHGGHAGRARVRPPCRSSTHRRCCGSNVRRWLIKF